MEGDTLDTQQKKNGSRNDFSGIFMDLVEKIPIKKNIYLVLILFVVLNDIFIGEVLSNINGAVDDDGTSIQPSTKGTVIQIIFIIIVYTILSIFIDSNLL